MIGATLPKPTLRPRWPDPKGDLYPCVRSRSVLRARFCSCRSCTPGSQSYVADGPSRGSLTTWASPKACTYARSCDPCNWNGSKVGENIALTANGSNVQLRRDVGAVTTDLTSLQTLDLTAPGGADTITVNDLAGTGTSKVNLDLSGCPEAESATVQPIRSS